MKQNGTCGVTETRNSRVKRKRLMRIGKGKRSGVQVMAKSSLEIESGGNTVLEVPSSDLAAG